MEIYMIIINIKMFCLLFVIWNIGKDDGLPSYDSALRKEMLKFYQRWSFGGDGHVSISLNMNATTFGVQNFGPKKG